MSWIKDNKFLVTLGGGTLAGVIVLVVVGMKGASRYAAAKEQFETAASDATSYEKQSLYPKQENRDGKAKAIEDYKKETEQLQAAFAPYRPEDLANISPQAFTDRLTEVNDELLAAFNGSGVKVPEDFFSGFERYRTSLANGQATGILKYQLEAVRHLMLALANSGATQLTNLHRPQLPEEAGGKWEAKPAQVARPLPLEITFVGPEKSARAFLSAVGNTDPYFCVIRSVRVANTKMVPPKASDAKFESAAAAKPETNIFGNIFDTPPDDAAGTAGDPAAAAPSSPPARVADSSRILVQVLGNEEVQVFVRLDLMQFLPAKKLP